MISFLHFSVWIKRRILLRVECRKVDRMLGMPVTTSKLLSPVIARVTSVKLIFNVQLQQQPPLAVNSQLTHMESWPGQSRNLA